MKVSIVIPCYNSEATIAEVVRLMRQEMGQLKYDYEFVLVNDASKDATFDVIRGLSEDGEDTVGVDCAKNHGQPNSIMAGLRLAEGDLILVMDDDMQTHPSQAPLLIKAIVDGGWDVVFGAYPQKKEKLWRRMGSRFAVWTTRTLGKRPKDIQWCNYFIMRKHIRDEVIKYTGPYVSIQGLIFRTTSNVANVAITHFNRATGRSGYTFRKLIGTWAHILNFTMLPLRIASVIGFVMSFVGFVSAIAVITGKLLNPALSAGWPSLMAVMLICSGFILLTLGIIGEYLGRMFMILNGEPQYVIREIIDCRHR